MWATHFDRQISLGFEERDMYVTDMLETYLFDIMYRHRCNVPWPRRTIPQRLQMQDDAIEFMHQAWHRLTLAILYTVRCTSTLLAVASKFHSDALEECWEDVVRGLLARLKRANHSVALEESLTYFERSLRS